MNKENVAYIDNRIQFHHKKAWSPIICDNLGGPGGQYVKWNKTNTERQTLWKCWILEVVSETMVTRYWGD
jgi:hypothetical protein